MANFFKAVNKAKAPTEALTITIDKLDINGVGMARWQNKPLFVAGTLPGEVVTVKVIEQKNKYARAKLITVKQESVNRIEPKCRHFGVCGGCDLQMLSLEEQLAFKQQKVSELFSRSFSALSVNTKKTTKGKGHSTSLLKTTSKTAMNSSEKLAGKIKTQPLPWHAPIKSTPWHYRRKARIGVQFDKNDQATVGFRQKSTNHLAAIKSCPVLVEPINMVFSLLKKVLAQLTVKSAIGHIEVIQADIDKSSDCVVLVIRQLKPMNDADITLWQQQALLHHWHIIIDDGKSQFPLTTLGEKGHEISLSYDLTDNSRITFASSDFIQINHQVNNAMIDQAIAWLDIKQSDTVLDLFCGLGNFSLAIAKKSKQVIGVEGVQVMVDKATLNAKANGVDNCQFYQADLNSHWLAESWANAHIFDKVLLDPARAGAEQAVTQLVKLKIPSVLYVSCDPTTLARDSAILVASGYTLSKILLMDMFSQTKHVETMVLFTR